MVNGRSQSIDSLQDLIQLVRHRVGPVDRVVWSSIPSSSPFAFDQWVLSSSLRVQVLVSAIPLLLLIQGLDYLEAYT